MGLGVLGGMGSGVKVLERYERECEAWERTVRGL